MREKLILIVSSIIGIASIFLPWVHYPNAKMEAYGYMGDGILTSALFLTVLVFSFLLPRFKNFLFFFSLIAGILIFGLGLFNLSEIRDQQINFKSDNIGITMASSGFYEGIGMYLHTFAGLGLFVGALLMKFRFLPENAQSTKITSLNMRTAIPYLTGVILLLGTLYFYKPELFNLRKNKLPDNFEQLIENDIQKMVKALENNDFDTYNKYVHPVVTKSMGGDQLMKDFFEGTYKTFKEDKIRIKEITVDKIIDVKTRTQDKQALFVQKVTFSQNGREFDESQKTLAVNDNKSSQWKYITLGNNKKMEEIKRIFPQINEQLNFSEN